MLHHGLSIQIDRVSEAEARALISNARAFGLTITDDQLSMQVDRAALARLLELGPPEPDLPLELVTGASKVCESKATRLMLTDPGAAIPARDARLVALLAEARATRDMVLAAPDRSLREIAAEQGRCRHRIAKLIRLSWLSPEIATQLSRDGRLAG